MLLDMVMLSTGLRESFRELLVSRGFQLRLSPRGTLPFDTEATITGAGRIIALLRANPAVVTVSPVLGGTIHVPRADSTVASFALGVVPSVQGDYELASGRDATAADALVANTDFLRATGARIGDTVRVVLPDSVLYERLWRPLTIAALNTQPEEASARLLWHLFAETFGRGGAALHALLPRDGLSESLVDPALGVLAARGAEVSFGHRLRGMTMSAGVVASLDFGAKGQVDIAADEAVLLAVTPSVASDLLPGLIAPTESRGIVNAHYRIAPPDAAVHSFVGVVGGTAEWIFVKPGHVSVTISAAEHLIDRAADDLAPAIWRDVQRVLELGATPMPEWRIVKEKRATFAATPAQLRRRPGPVTAHHNLFLAGDWTDTGWPSTIEGAIRSGFAAAQAIAA